MAIGQTARVLKTDIHTYSVKEFEQLLKNQGLSQVTVEKYKINSFLLPISRIVIEQSI
jgi:hypothetical protein